MNFDEIIKRLEEEANPAQKENMERFAINPQKTYCINMPVLRKIAKEIGINHELALQLWDYDFHETKLLATLIDDYTLVTPKQFDKWTYSFTTWNECDQACLNLFYKVDYVMDKISEYAACQEEFVKRCAFSLIAVLAVHKKDVDDDYFINFFPLIVEASSDNRNFVKKAVNWSIRQIGKKNRYLNKKALELSYEILDSNTKSGKWIANNAIRELKSVKVQERLKN